MKRDEFLSNLEVNVKKINTNISGGVSVNKIAPELFQCREDNIRKWLKDVGYTRNKISKLFVVNDPTTSNIKAVVNNTTKDYKPVIKTNKSSYKPVIEKNKNDYESVMDSNKPAYNTEKDLQEVDDVIKTKLLEFKDLSIQDKVIMVNEKAMGKKTLAELSKGDDEGFDFNVSNYMNQYHKSEVQWDGAIKCYKVIRASQQELPFNEEEIDILKSFVERQKAIKTLVADKDKGEDKVHSVRCYTNIYSQFKEICDVQNIRIQDALGIALNDYINKK